MRLPIWLLLFAAALVSTFVVIKVGTERSDAQAATLVFVLGAAGAVVWGIVSMSAFELVSLDGGTEHTYSYPSLAVLAVIGAGINLFAMAKAAIETIDFGGMSR